MKFGTNILVDFDRRAEDKTTSNVLILGNSGYGKSYLLKLLLTNIRESGKRIICLDPESEYEELCSALGGCYIDFMSGEYTINPLEPKAWADDTQDIDASTPEAFKKVTRLSQHIAFLKDFLENTWAKLAKMIWTKLTMPLLSAWASSIWEPHFKRAENRMGNMSNTNHHRRESN